MIFCLFLIDRRVGRKSAVQIRTDRHQIGDQYTGNCQNRMYSERDFYLSGISQCTWKNLTIHISTFVLAFSQPCMAPEQQIQPPSWSWSPPLTPNEKRTPALSFTDVNPPEPQKMIVQHTVRPDDATTQLYTSPRLRPFSWRCPHSLKDIKQPDLQKSWRLLESLHDLSCPAIDMIRYKCVLDSQVWSWRWGMTSLQSISTPCKTKTIARSP